MSSGAVSRRKALARNYKRRRVWPGIEEKLANDIQRQQ